MYCSLRFRRIRSQPSKSNSCISPPTRRISANSRISGLYGPSHSDARSRRSSKIGLSVLSSSRDVCTPRVIIEEARSMGLLLLVLLLSGPLFFVLRTRISFSLSRDSWRGNIIKPTWEKTDVNAFVEFSRFLKSHFAISYKERNRNCPVFYPWTGNGYKNTSLSPSFRNISPGIFLYRKLFICEVSKSRQENGYDPQCM